MKMEKVNCSYGAPMGRRADGYIETAIVRGARLARVPLNAGGYDNGGAYWGTSGEHLWCCIDHDGARQFVRACSREKAAFILGMGALALKVADRGTFISYGMQMLDGKAPIPKGFNRHDVCRFLQRSGVAMGQETHVVHGLRVPSDMFA